MTGTVFNIQAYSLHDGPGIRTVVFLKGCPLRCVWCSNPESQRRCPEIYFDRDKCIRSKGCNWCDGKCPENAIKDGVPDFSSCNNCQKCAASCPSRALSVYGKEMSVDEVLAEVESQQAFYRHGNGGLTLSGGEPLMQSEFAIALLKAAKKQKIHTAIETCGYCGEAALLTAAEYIDYFMYDIKLFDDEKHKAYTGASNALILGNLKKLFEKFPNTLKKIRTPVIPGVNDSVEEIGKIKKFLSPFHNYTYELLPYHRFGEKKYTMLGRKYPDLPKKLEETQFELLKNMIQVK